MIKFEDIPFQYGFCQHAACPPADTCLRHLALSALPEGQSFVPTLHPRHFPAEGESCCTHYRSNAKVRYARGFRKVLRTFPVNVLETFRDQLTTTFKYNRYYQLRRGDLPISPKEQELIRKVAREKGFKETFTFDAYEEGYPW